MSHGIKPTEVTYNALAFSAGVEVRRIFLELYFAKWAFFRQRLRGHISCLRLWWRCRWCFVRLRLHGLLVCQLLLRKRLIFYSLHFCWVLGCCRSLAGCSCCCHSRCGFERCLWNRWTLTRGGRRCRLHRGLGNCWTFTRWWRCCGGLILNYWRYEIRCWAEERGTKPLNLLRDNRLRRSWSRSSTTKTKAKESFFGGIWLCCGFGFGWGTTIYWLLRFYSFFLCRFFLWEILYCRRSSGFSKCCFWLVLSSTGSRRRLMWSCFVLLWASISL